MSLVRPCLPAAFKMLIYVMTIQNHAIVTKLDGKICQDTLVHSKQKCYVLDFPAHVVYWPLTSTQWDFYCV